MHKDKLIEQRLELILWQDENKPMAGKEKDMREEPWLELISRQEEKNSVR